MIVLLLYVVIFAFAFAAYRLWESKRHHLHDFASLKTVTFGDESAVSPNRFASVISIIALFGIWGAFTGSAITPLHVPGPFVGDTSFTYTARNAAGETDDATVFMRVYRVGEDVPMPETSADQPGFAVDDALKIGAWRSALARPHENDIGGDEDGYSIIAIDGQPIAPDGTVRFSDGEVTMTSKGSLSIKPDRGWQMEPIWLPAPEAVVSRLGEIASEGYKNVSLWEHLGYSLGRVIAGFVIGSIIGIPLGYAMGLSNWFRGWFDPIVEFMRPVPPLALIPLIIIWFGIGEEGKVILLFLAALWIMTISARAGVSGGAHLQGACGLFAGRIEMADPAPRHRTELAAGDLHRRARRHGRLLGHGCGGRTRRRRSRRRHDDRQRVEVPAHRHRHSGHHPDRHHRLRHRYPDAHGRENGLCPGRAAADLKPHRKRKPAA